jgi:hypothetical protein
MLINLRLSKIYLVRVSKKGAIRLSKIYLVLVVVISFIIISIIIISLEFKRIKRYLKKVSDNNNKIPVYLFKGKPLQNKFNNDYNRAEKIEIILQLQMTLIMVFYPLIPC